MVSLFHQGFILYIHIEILPVLVSNGSSKFLSWFKNTLSKKFEFPYILVLLSFTPHFFCVPCSSIRGNISSEMVRKSTNMYDRVNKYTAKYLLIMDGQIKSKRLCRSTFCERDMLSNCVKHKPDAWWLVIFLLLEWEI